MTLSITEYQQYDGLGLAELVRNKDVSSLELVEAAIGVIEEKNPELNAVIHRMYHQARMLAKGELPQGPFTGVPFLLKDLGASYAHIPTHNGSRYSQDFTLGYDSEQVVRFRRAGLIVCGKTNTPEFGLSPVTEPELFGPSRNPYDPTRTPGGSSGGSAAAVASGMVPMASGGDGGGSLRIPASCCGLVGLKTSRGMTPAGPDMFRAWQGCAVQFGLARSVRDTAALLDVVAGPDLGAVFQAPLPEQGFLKSLEQPLKPLKIAVSVEPFFPSEVHEDCVAAVQHAAKLCESLGHHVDYAAPTVPADELIEAFLNIVGGELAATIKRLQDILGYAPSRHDLELPTWTLLRLGQRLSAEEFANAVYTIDTIGRMLAEFFTEYDMLLTPTLATPPLKVGEFVPTPMQHFSLKLVNRFPNKYILRKIALLMDDELFKFIPFTPLFNATGHPAISVPLYKNADGLPIGVQFATAFAGDARLLQLANQLLEA